MLGSNAKAEADGNLFFVLVFGFIEFHLTALACHFANTCCNFMVNIMVRAPSRDLLQLLPPFFGE